MTKEQVKEILERANHKVYIVSINSNATQYRIFAIDCNSKSLIELSFEQNEDYPACWIPIHKTKSGRWIGGYFQDTSIGASRPFTIIDIISRWLYGEGYKIKYIPLN